ncbi:hypothetical protein [Haloferula sp. BvORR071]|uniref:hypothetical protein n=1 Tax=Haloferula sp. BvORR071 TaxID=1396141 RepID=UPI002240F84A|nr:hypothetical protein [Haloferula sp. BvORR071]
MRSSPVFLRPGFRPVISNRLLSAAVVLACGLAIVEVAGAAARTATWIGGDGDWDSVYGGESWSTAASPDTDDNAILNTDHTVRLIISKPWILTHMVGSINMSGSCTLKLNNRSINVAGLTSVSGNGTLLDGAGLSSLLLSRIITVSNGGTIFLDGGTIMLRSVTDSSSLTIGTGSMLSGNGVITTEENYSPPLSSNIVNNGLIAVSKPSVLPTTPPEPGELRIAPRSYYGFGHLDLDGSTEAGVVTVGRNQTFITDLPLADEFNGSLSMFHDSHLEIGSNSNPIHWSLGSGGTIEIDNGATTGTGGAPAGTATIVGAGFTQTGGTISVADADGTLQLDVPYTFNGGLLNNQGRVILKKNASIGAGASFVGTGTLSIAEGSEVVTEAGANTDTALELQGSLRIGSANTIAEVTVQKLQMGPSGKLNVDITGTSPAQYDRVTVNGVAELNGTLSLRFGEESPGVPFVPAVGQKFNILSASGGVTGTFKTLDTSATPSGLAFRINYLSTGVEAEVVSDDKYELWINRFPAVASSSDRLYTADPDQDGLNNLMEFALDEDPSSGKLNGKVVTKIASVNGEKALTLTFPVHNAGAIYDSPEGEFLVIGMMEPYLHYKVQASDDLVTFPINVDQVSGADATAIQADLPALGAGWSYITCRSHGPLAGNHLGFLRLDISEGPLPP